MQTREREHHRAERRTSSIHSGEQTGASLEDAGKLLRRGSLVQATRQNGRSSMMVDRRASSLFGSD